MKIIDFIGAKKLGYAHTQKEIDFFISELTKNNIPDYQLSAWLMAVYFNGMTPKETAFLTQAIVNSGETMDLSEIGDNIVDKHSTGGVGDKITLILIPLLASCEIPVAKLSGRGLGHTGGTIDKLESIPNFNTNLDTKKFIEIVKQHGCAIASQTKKLAPADGKLYALRDVTSTVDSLPLVCSSVVSKKIASGANTIILDVKYGTGSFNKTQKDAEKLSKLMVKIGKELNRSITAVITSMEEPLGFMIGNSLEVIESIKTLQGKGPKDIEELTLELASIALIENKKASSKVEAKKILLDKLNNGEAYIKFKEMVQAQGGDVKTIENISLLPCAKQKYEFKSKEEGFISKADALEIAKACKTLGAGRETKEDKINHAVGIELKVKTGDFIKKGETLAIIHSDDEEKTLEAKKVLKKAFCYENKKPLKEPLIYKTITA